jgi:hypothetical protein
MILFDFSLNAEVTIKKTIPAGSEKRHIKINPAFNTLSYDEILRTVSK